MKNNDKTDVNFLSNIDLPLKRSWHFEGEESAVWSWHSADEKRKSKYIDAYTSSYYSKTDFSDVDDKYPQVRFCFHFDISPILFFTKTFHSI